MPLTPADELALIGAQKQEATVLGRKFRFRTLNADEEAMAENAASLFNGTTKIRVLRVEKLARAIESIEGHPFQLDDSDKAAGKTVLNKARESVYKWQPPVVDKIYAEYEKLEVQRDNAVSELEKNGKSPATSTGAGR